MYRKAIVQMKICVVTPYFQENLEWVVQAHASVKSQTIEARHILVCDGSAPAQIPDFQGTHIVLQRNYRDHGNTPRLIGCYNAINDDADAIAFLDADSWYYPDHLKSLTAIATNTQLGAVASARMLHQLDGTPMVKCPTVDGQRYIDTSCLLVFRPAFRHLIAWALQGQETAADTGQFLWKQLRDSGTRMAFVDRPTVAHRAGYRQQYENVGEVPPPGAIAAMEALEHPTLGTTGVPAQSPSTFAGPSLTIAGFPASQSTFTGSAMSNSPSAPAPLAAVESRAPALFGGDIADQHATFIKPLFNLPAILPNSAWSGHIPFLFTLFRMLRPATFVELGVHTGASLIAAATAASIYQLPTQLVGIDTFLGDEHSGQYDGDSLYNGLLGYFARTFPSVHLERSYFADALPRFPRHSIDVLHIDGLHTYEAVRQDFTTWFDRVSPTGVILMHDISVRERGFGVHLLWEELKGRLTTLEFPHSHGLGVVLLAPNDERMRPLAALARNDRAMRAYSDLVAEVARVLPERMSGRI